MGASSTLHESQSRLWENVVGRSLPFWSWFYPRVQETFPEQLGSVPLESFHRAVNRARRSFIRVDADETSYGLHLILRFELEQELISGRLAVADLPEAWNARFEALMGVAVPNDSLGVLQDSLGRSIRNVFAANTLLVVVALLCGFLLPQTRPAASEDLVPEQDGEKFVMAEMTVIDAEHEPECC